ncbi:MAG: hypothetical protein MJZ90_07655 [Bacteroidales bacterium]|nr:hypothetical protein [Bacteroidales bacterium]
MRPKYFAIILILSSAMLASCNSSRRAARRIQRIAESHPELLVVDTVRIDTLLVFAPPADTAVFDPDTEPGTDSCVVIGAAHGAFTVKRLPSRRFQVTYTPDTAVIRYREDVPVRTAVIREQTPWRRKLRNFIFIFIVVLLAVRLNNELKRLSGK